MPERADIVLDGWGSDGLGAVAALIDRASPVDRFPLDQLREAVFEDMDFDRALLIAAWANGALAGAIAGVRRGERGHAKLFAVAPEWRRRGIGSRLLGELEDRLGQRGARTCRIFHDAPYYLRPGVDFRLTDMVSMLERRGYEQKHAACNMVVDLTHARLDTSEAEVSLATRGIVIRRLEHGDRDHLAVAAMSPNWRVEVARSFRRAPISTHIALQGDAIVAFATHSVSGPAQFGPMQTDPSLRGLGIGALLLRRCLADLRSAGFPRCDIQWVGPKGFYADHVGARIDRCFWQYEKALAPS